jgi:hypothetical protein
LFIVGQLLFRPATQEVGKALGRVSKNYFVPTKDEASKGINESGRENVGPAPSEGGKTFTRSWKIFKGYGVTGGVTAAFGRCKRAIIGPFSDSALVSLGNMPSKGVVPLVYSL